MKVLSLFDGMACGMIAMLNSGVQVDEYVAYEIDKYAIQTATHNFPMIKECGDVFKADFTQYKGFDYLIGGSPCTYWSIAQTKNRETVASGMGWELFSQYVRALHEAQPTFFIYENNKSMSNDIRQSITQTFGFEPICINSALVSAQNRQRLYWVGKRNDDGTYSKVNVELPEDRGILLKDVLESAVCGDLTGNNKSYTITASYDGACAWNTIERHQRNMVAEPINPTASGKGHTLTATYYKAAENPYSRFGNEKGRTRIAEPVCVAQRGRMYRGEAQHYEARDDGKTNTLTSVEKDNRVAEPIRVGCMPSPNGELKNSQGMRVYSIDGKSVNQTSQGGGMGAKTGLYAIPVYDDLPVKEPTKAISAADGKEYPVYKVENGQITIKGKTSPIKLADGYYIIRKLTVRECMRLQTVPEWYEFPVSNSQAYKMLGNGWTCDVITHLIKATMGVKK